MIKNRPGVVLARPAITLALRLPLAASVLLLSASVAAADARLSHDPNTLARAGTAAIEKQRFAEALEAFSRAADLRPGDANLCFGAGLAAFMLGQDAVARTRFECALALNPYHLLAAMWLGDLHYRAGRLPEAISTYEIARKLSPGDRELQQVLEDWRKEHELQRRFHHIRTEHFTALYESAADELLARKVIDRLEAAYSRIGKMLGVYPSEPVTVVLYTREQFEDITRLASWTAAAYDGRIRVPIGDALEQPDELDRVLSHELVHVIVAKLGGRTVPAWVNEGLATVLEPAGLEQPGPTLPRVSARLRLTKLHGSFGGLSTRDAEIAYASAARAVRRVIDERGMAAVVALLEDLARGAPFARAFQQRVAMRYEAFAARVARD